MRFIDSIILVLNFVLVTTSEITSTVENELGEMDDSDGITNMINLIVAVSILGLIIICIICGALWSYMQRRH
jgi:hypothetical protein